MARLKEPIDFPEYDDYDDFETYMEEEESRFEELKGEHTILQFPHADGYAQYAVVQKEPLVLRHIPYGDGWQKPAAFIRGLRWSDVTKMNILGESILQ